MKLITWGANLLSACDSIILYVHNYNQHYHLREAVLSVRCHVRATTYITVPCVYQMAYPV